MVKKQKPKSKEELAQDAQKIIEFNLKHPTRKGLYFSDGIEKVFDKPLPRVSTLLDVLSKPGLAYWQTKKVAEICLDKDQPILDPKEAMAKHFQDNVMAKADKGSLIHNLIKQHLLGEDVNWESVSEEYLPYIDAYFKFIEEHQPKVKHIERILYSDVCAGQADLIYTTADDLTIIADWKTGKSIFPTMGIQLKAYSYCFESMGLGKVDKMGVVHLKDDGEYSLHWFNEPLSVLLACYEIYRWRKGSDE